MDQTRDITSRGFVFNDASIADDISSGKVTGSVVDTFDMSDVDVVQAQAKRALGDGLAVSDVFQGGRRLRMAGTLYGASRGALFDLWDDFMAATNPVLAQRESPADKGYLPLYYSKATERVDYVGVIDLMVRAMPRSRQAVWQRRQQGGDDTDPLAIPWQATWIMKDPVVYSADYVDVDLSAGGTVAADLVNRGNYIAALNMLVVVDGTAGSIDVNVGGATVTITVPSSTGNRTIRYKGRDQGGPVLTVEENSVELVRFDLLDLGSAQAHPVIPNGTSALTVTFTGVNVQAGSHAWFWEAYS